MLIVHEMLYRSPNLSYIDLTSYIERLCGHLFNSYDRFSQKIDFKLDISIQTLDLDTAIPFGLILNELISNALKHAFPQQQQGRIEIKVAPTANGEIALTVSDNGCGLPANMNIAETTSLGLKLVKNLTKQLKGKLEITGQTGSILKISFPTNNLGRLV
jgi:two-component sensor histidine kinase